MSTARTLPPGASSWLAWSKSQAGKVDELIFLVLK